MSPNAKEFLMTLAATTVSIILTFGTSAVLDKRKEKAEKREMALMILYDMRESLDNMRQIDADLNAFFDAQVEVVAHPDKLGEFYLELATRVPVADYTTTTENIFRSNIETIQTLGSILFIQSVSTFYDSRAGYKEMVLEDFQKHADDALSRYEDLRDLRTTSYLFLSEAYLRTMSRDYEQCKILMKVSEKDLDVFSQQQKELLEATEDGSMNALEQYSKVQEDRNERLRKAIEQGKKELNK
jgi:hypothetical protein